MSAFMTSTQPSSSTTAPPPRGLLIVIEGLDRSGKSTQCTRLLTHLLATGHPTILQKFPDRSTPTGTLINQYLTNQTTQDDHAIHLLFSANRWEASQSILAHLLSGTTVLVDRYSFSGAVYSAAKNIPGLGLEWAWAPEVGLPVPDVVLFLDLDLKVQVERGGFGEERYEKGEMQGRVKGLYGELFGSVESGGMGVWVERVDAGVGVEEVEGRVWEVVQNCFTRLKGSSGEIRKLKPLGGGGGGGESGF